jgi:hypothetical protein
MPLIVLEGNDLLHLWQKLIPFPKPEGLLRPLAPQLALIYSILKYLIATRKIDLFLK